MGGGGGPFFGSLLGGLGTAVPHIIVTSASLSGFGGGPVLQNCHPGPCRLPGGASGGGSGCWLRV